MTEENTPYVVSDAAASLTDRAKTVQFLKELGIGFKEASITENEVANGDGETNTIVLQEGYDKVKGYHGFFTEFCFDDAGKLVKVGIWE